MVFFTVIIYFFTLITAGLVTTSVDIHYELARHFYVILGADDGFQQVDLGKNY